MADLLFASVLVLNLTGVFVFLGPAMGLSIAAISEGLLIATVCYLVFRWPVTKRLIGSREIRLWLVLWLMWPIASAIVAANADVRMLALQAYYACLFMATGVLVASRGWPALRTTIGIAIGATALGIVLSLTQPDAFEVVADRIGAQGDHRGRAFGFFIQPNVTAENTVFLFVAWFAAGRSRAAWSRGAAVILLFIMVGMTGSRGGFLAAVVVSLLMMFDSVQRHPGSARRRFSPGLIFASRAVGIAGAATLLVWILNVASGAFSNTDAGGVLERLRSLMTDQVSSTLMSDVSLGERVLSVQQHLVLLLQHPWFGYGVGATGRFLSNGEVFAATHNVFLELAVNFGIPYVMFLLWLLLRLLSSARRGEVERALRDSLYAQLVAGIVLVGLVSNTVLYSRTLIPILGGAVALLSCRPSSISSFEDETPAAVARDAPLGT